MLQKWCLVALLEPTIRSIGTENNKCREIKMDIKAIRTSAYMTQEKFAKAIGVHINSVRAWEQGKNKPSLTQQGKIAEFCKEHNIKGFNNEN